VMILVGLEIYVPK